MWNYVMLSVLVKQYTCQLFNALFFPHYLLHLSLTQCLYIQLCFLFISHLNWSGWWQYLRSKTQSSNKTVLPLGGDSTPVVHAREPALPHITQTLADFTHTTMDREPASPNLTPTPVDSNPAPVDTTPSPPQSSQTRAVSKAAPVRKVPVLARRTPTPPVSTPIHVEEA